MLKGLDTTWLFFEVDFLLGFVWLLTVDSLLATRRWWCAPGVALLASFKLLGTGMNLFFTALGVAFVGAALGIPAGMAIGTVIGHLRRHRIVRAPDAGSEGTKPYVAGLLAPTAFLAVAVPFYVFWLMPRLADWLS